LFLLVGSTSKSGFKTVYKSAGFKRWVFAEAIAANGESLGNSSIEEIITPPGFEFNSWDSNEHDDSYSIAHGATNDKSNNVTKELKGLMIDHIETASIIYMGGREYYLVFVVIVVFMFLAFTSGYIRQLPIFSRYLYTY
jgi:hypothetical protein